MLSKILKDPLLHFLIIGGLIFQVYQWRNINDEDVFVVSRDTVAQLQQQYEKTWLRSPSQEQLQLLINNYVLDELYAKHAFALDMHLGDQVVNRRMRVKLALLNELLVEPPTENEVSNYYLKNPERYKQRIKYSFEQRFFDQQMSMTDLADRMRALNNGESVVSHTTMLLDSYEELTLRHIQRDFGGEFAEWVSSLDIGNWQGPFKSPLGWHFVKLTNISEAPTMPLNEIYDLVEADTKQAKLQALRDDFEKQLLEAQEIRVEWPEENK